MMKILLTGSTGMVGRNILEHPGAKDYELLTPSSSELNLKDYDAVNQFLKQHQPDMIIHAAGKVGGIQANIKEPVNFLVDNLDMGRNIVLGAKANNVKYLLNLGSSCMYPRNGENPLKEEMVLTGELEPTNEGYALAKVTVARLCEYINREDSNFRYKTIIPCNLYGRWDKFDPKASHLLPAIIKKLDDAKSSNNSQVEIWGDGEARREFMYAGDLADFIYYAVDKFQEMPEVMNVGLGYDYSIKEYYQTAADNIGFAGDFVHDLSKPVGMKQKLVDVAKLKNFGWKPKFSLAEGIKQTYSYYIDEYRSKN
jgi:GDP-L-fucose synthase